MRKYKGYRYLICFLILYIALGITFILDFIYGYLCFVEYSYEYLLREIDIIMFRWLLCVIIGIFLVFRENKNSVSNNHVNMKQLIFRLIRNLTIIILIGYILIYIQEESSLYRLSDRLLRNFIDLTNITNIAEESYLYFIIEYTIDQFLLGGLTIIYIGTGFASYEIMGFIYNIRMLKINNRKDSKI